MKKRKAPFPWGIGLAKLGPRKYLFDANLAVNLDFIEQQGFDLVEAVDKPTRPSCGRPCSGRNGRSSCSSQAGQPLILPPLRTSKHRPDRFAYQKRIARGDFRCCRGLYYIVMEHVNGPTLEEG